MPTLRILRVAELLKREIGEAIRREIPVAQAGLVSVNDVDVSAGQLLFIDRAFADARLRLTRGLSSGRWRAEPSERSRRRYAAGGAGSGRQAGPDPHVA